jgi:hypothetical protein
MLPIRPLEGKEVKGWNRWAWHLYFIPVFILYLRLDLSVPVTSLP